MITLIKNNIVKFLIAVYFVNALIEIVAEFYSTSTIIFLAKPLIPFLLIALYWFSSVKRNPVFILILFLSLITNLLFIPKSPECLFYGVIAFTVHRILLIYLIFRLAGIKNWKLFAIVTIPLLFIFFYLFFASSDVPQNTYGLLVVHNLMGAVLGGIGISNYMINDNKQHSLLMISVLLFLGLQLVIYVERYYLYNISLEYIRPLAMLLNVLAFFTFYKYVLATESNHNRTPGGS